MNILVTGGGGFLGSAVCRQLAEKGHDVVALQRRPATHLEPFGVRSVEADIDDADGSRSDIGAYGGPGGDGW